MIYHGDTETRSKLRILSVHEAQLLTYLKLTGKQVGLITNFNVCNTGSRRYRAKGFMKMFRFLRASVSPW